MDTDRKPAAAETEQQPLKPWVEPKLTVSDIAQLSQTIAMAMVESMGITASS